MSKAKRTNVKFDKKKLTTIILIMIICLFAVLTFVQASYTDPETGETTNIPVLLKLGKQLTYALTNTSGDTEQARIKYNFNYDWKFSKGQGYENSGSTVATKTESITIPDTEQANIVSGAYETNTWEDVSLPHTYNDTDTYDDYVENKGNQGLNGERQMYTGTAWYEKEFFIPADYEGKRIFIEFEAARQMAVIFVNGTQIEGTYENGFIAFGYDLTEALKYGETNRIVVKVDNSFPYYIKDAEGNNTANAVAWQDSHWHPNYGGLYRNSYLYVMDDLHLTLPLYSFTKSQGTYVYTKNETANSADIHVDPEIENSSTEAKTFNIVAKVKDASGNVVLTLNQDNITIEAGAKTVYNLSGTLQNPIRWSTEYPYLYTIECQVWQGEVLIDNNENTLGIRTFRITTDYGFYLNENYVELNGWGQKSTNEWAAVGAAYPDWMQSYVIQMMKNAGGNLVRWGHTAGSPAQIESSDKYGLLVIQPGVDGEGETPGCYSLYNTASYKLRIEAFRDMLIYFRNNPSIVMWEIGNQSTGMGTTVDPVEGAEDIGTTTVTKMLYGIVQKYDYANRDSGVINSGSYENTKTDSDRLITVRQTSLITNNEIDVVETTMGGQYSNNTDPKIESEYIRMEARRGVWDIFTTGFTNYTNGATDLDFKDKTSEDLALIQITDKKSILSTTGYVGGANWIFSDSISHGRLATEVARTSGEVDGMMLEKEAYWVDKVIFSTDTSSHIIGHWNYPEGTTKDINVAAKGVKSLELFVNGVSKGITTASSDYLYTFENIDYEAGEISVVGYDEEGNKVDAASSSIKTHGDPASIKITPIIGADGALANGSDVVLMDVEVVDSNGNRCLTYDGTVSNDYTRFTINDDEGTCEWRGGYNSGIEDSINNKYLYVEAGITRIAIRTTRTAGDIRVSATTDKGLTSNIAVVITQEVPDATLNGVTLKGLSLQENSLESYSLDTLTDPGIGNGDKLGINPEDKPIANSSVLIEQFSYIGNKDYANRIADSFSSGKQMYSDTATTFTKVPVKYENAEYLLLPSIDNVANQTDFIAFTAKRNITIAILHDDRIALPVWMNEYTKTTDIVIGGNGVTYTIYTKEVTKETGVNIGTTAPDSEEGAKGGANIIIFKETTLVENGTLMKEDFDDTDKDTLLNGYNAGIGINTDITVDSTTFASDEAHKEVLYFTDNNITSSDENYAYIEKEFPDQTGKFTFKFDAYVPTGSMDNKYLRTFLSDGKLNSPADTTTLVTQTYLHKSNSSTMGVYATYKADVKDYEVKDLSLDTWHTYEYTIDPVNKKWTLSKVDNVNCETEPHNFFNAFTKVNTFTIGTGRARTSEFYLDNIEIKPIIEELVTGIKINGTQLNGFVPDKYEYTVATALSAETKIEVDVSNTDYLKNYTYQFIADDGTNLDRIVVKVTDAYGDVLEYTIRYEKVEADLLNGFTVVGTNGSSLIIENAVYDGKDAIHFYDNILSNSGKAYITKTFDPQYGKFEFTYDINIPTSSTFQNKWTKICLSNGMPTSDSDTNGRAVETYFNKSTATKSFLSYRQQNTIDSANDVVFGGTQISHSTWQSIKYVVDVLSKKIDIYINDFENPVATNLDLRELFDSTSIDSMLFATGGNSTADFYITNINVTPLYSYPINGIKVDGNQIVNFSQEKDTYEYYTNQNLTESTIITVDENMDYLENSLEVVKDINNQFATITVKNKANESYTYKVFFIDLLERVISKEELQKLIDETRVAYPTVQKDDYVEKCWENLEAMLTAGDKVIAEDAPTNYELSLAYYNIEQAIANMLKYKSFDYNSGLIEIVKYSEDIEGKFEIEKILENDVRMYKDTPTNTFYSIPYRYWNGEFIRVNKTLSSNYGAIQFRALVDLTVTIMQDRRAGTCLEVDFEETGEIMTDSTGTVYKVYTRTYTKGEAITLDFDKAFANNITDQNNIISFKPTGLIRDNLLINQDFEYITTEQLKAIATVYQGRDPESLVEDKVQIVNMNKQTHEVEANESENTERVLNMQSLQKAEMSYLFKEFAKITDKVKMSFSILFPKTSTVGDTSDGQFNKFNRIWLLQGLGKNPNTQSDEKSNAIVEQYIDTASNTEESVGTYYYKNTPYDKADAISYSEVGTLGLGEWGNYAISYDLTNKKLTVKLNDGPEVEIPDAYHMNNPTYASTIGLYNRRAELSDVYYNRFTVEPITRDIIKNIMVDGNLLRRKDGTTDYYALTKDYLYKYDIGATTPANTVTVTEGSTYDEESTIIQKTSTTEYATINLVDSDPDEYTFKNRVYFEVNVDKTELTRLIKEAEKVNKELYTEASYNKMAEALEAARKILSDTNVTQTEVDTAAALLQDAINGLVPQSDGSIIIKANLYEGNQLDYTEKDIIDVSSNSSITMKTTMEKTFGVKYDYAGLEHRRKLIANSTEPDYSFPAGTKLTLIDNTIENSPKYYYYLVTAEDKTNNKTEYLLSDFTKMGTIDTKFKNDSINIYNEGTKELYESLSFIIDFENVATEETLETGEYEIQYKIETDDGSITMNPLSIENCKYALHKEEKTNLLYVSKDHVVAYQGESVSIDLTNVYSSRARIADFTDTTVKDKKLGILISVYDENNMFKEPFPVGLTVTLGTETSIIDGNGTASIKYSDVVATNLEAKTLTITPAYKDIVLSGSFNMKFELLESYDGLNYGKVVSSQTVELELLDEYEYGIKATLKDGYKPVLKQGYTDVLGYTIESYCTNETQVVTTAVRLQKKNATGEYEDVDITDYVTNTLPLRTNTQERLIVDKEVDLVIKGNIEKGTYRFVFEAFNERDPDKVVGEDFENFVVK